MTRKTTGLKKLLAYTGKRLKARSLAKRQGTPVEREAEKTAVKRLRTGDEAAYERAKQLRTPVVRARAKQERTTAEPAATTEPVLEGGTLPSAEGKLTKAVALKVKFTDRFLQSPCDPETGKPLEQPPEGKRIRIWDAHTNGLGLRITSNGAKSFFVTRRLKGEGKAQPITVVIGPYPHVSLKEARDKADDLIRDLKKGVDPREVEAEKRKAKAEKAKAEAARRANRFAAVAETFIERYVATKRTAGPIAQLVRRRLVSRWGDLPITDIDRGKVIAMIEEIAEQSPTAAHQALAYARLLFDWAIERDIYGLKSSPCHPIKVDRLIPDLPESRQRVLDDNEIKLLWRATRPSPDSEAVYPVGQFIRLLLVLGCRRGELSNMTWDEVDLDRATWTLQGDRTKNSDPRLIPLPALAVDILAATPRFTGSYVFSTTYGRRPISGFAKIKAALDGRIAELNNGEPLPGWRLHDLRRTMRTRLSALPILPMVAELMIGHRQSGIQAVYDLHRYEAEQRAGFEAWCNRLTSIVERSGGGNVIPFSATQS
jgi:integrase